MFRWHSLTVLIFLLVVATPAAAKSASAQFRAQVSAIIKSYRNGDTAGGRQQIEQFRLSNAQDWFSEHLGSEQGADLANRYERLYADFAESLAHTIEAIVAQPGADLVTDITNSKTETPTFVRPGAKLSGMVSIHPVAFLFGSFQITVHQQNAISWGDTFVEQDGSFRFLGFGGSPFWVWQNGSEGGNGKQGYFSTPPILISRVDPVYPPEAKSNNVGGVVVVRVMVDKDGSVKKAEIIDGNPLLAQAALDAVRQWHYKPGTIGGTVVESSTRAEINFSSH